MCEMNVLLSIHCGTTPAADKHAVVFILSEDLEATDSSVANDDTLNELYAAACIHLHYKHH
jgi:hypothetical protein